MRGIGANTLYKRLAENWREGEIEIFLLPNQRCLPTGVWGKLAQERNVKSLNLTKIKKKKIGKGIDKTIFNCLTEPIPEPIVEDLTKREEEIKIANLAHDAKLSRRKIRRYELVVGIHKSGRLLTPKQIRRYVYLARQLEKERPPQEIIDQFLLLSKSPLSHLSWEDYQATKGVKVKKLPRFKVKKRKNKKGLKYKTYILSNFWEERKNRYWQNHEKRCSKCGTCKFIALHHAVYDHKAFGNELDSHLFPLCGSCHSLFHQTHGVKRNMLKETITWTSQEII